MKIAFVTFGNFDGHATLKRATGMASPLIEAGHEVTLLLEDCSVNREKAAMECPEAHVVWHSRGSNAWSERSEKQRSLNQLKPDLVWICGVGPRNWVSRPSKDCFLLADHSELFSQVGESVLRRKFYSLLEWGYCFSFDGHVCASRYLERYYKKRLGRLKKSTRVHYSPYAFHPSVIAPYSTGVAKLHERWSGRKALVYMGSFWENYGFWDMLDVFKELSREREDFVAILAGRGPEKDRGIEWVKENGLEDVIRIEGYVAEEELSAYFTAAHAFISPLRDTVQDWARCPSKLFMYLPFGKPVITCRIGEAKELFGEKGVYYTAGDRKSLKAAIVQVLENSESFELPDYNAHTYAARTKSFLAWYAAQ